MLGFSLGSIVCSLIVGYICTRIGASYSRNLRSVFFKKVESFSMNEINQFSTSSLITRTTNDISQVQSIIIMGMRMLITAPLMAVLAFVKILQTSPDMSIITIGCIVALVASIITIFMFAIPKFKKMQKLLDRLNLVSRENLTGLRVVRAYNSEKFQENRIEEVASDFASTNFKVGIIMSFLNPVMTTILSGLTLFIYWFGASLAQQNVINIGQIMAFAQYSIMILSSFSSFDKYFVPLASKFASFRLFTFADSVNL